MTKWCFNAKQSKLRFALDQAGKNMCFHPNIFQIFCLFPHVSKYFVTQETQVHDWICCGDAAAKEKTQMHEQGNSCSRILVKSSFACFWFSRILQFSVLLNQLDKRIILMSSSPITLWCESAFVGFQIWLQGIMNAKCSTCHCFFLRWNTTRSHTKGVDALRLTRKSAGWCRIWSKHFILQKILHM